MDTPVPFRREPCTPKSRNSKVRLNKPTPKSTPTRNRKRYDPQRRLEVAETRRNGACARCREKKVRCTPAQHKSSASGSPESTRDNLSNSSRLSRNDALTSTNNGSTILGVEDCVQTAKEYLKVAQSHVEKFASFIDAWESSKKASDGNGSSNDDINILKADSRTMTRGSSQQSERSLFNEETLYSYNPHANEPDEVKMGLSDLGQKTYIYRDQAIIPPTSTKSTNGKKTMLVPKDRNRFLCPKSDLVEKVTWHPAKEKAPSSEMERWRPSLTGENESRAAFIG
ncbi:hypothetical protein NA56DRAFT_649448 [Hyaloscypha hepaticicola]|uniref:Zn(2)-C6 fungal-type domain-containing protein n=1 Tax=Hyaloscypha hepaticicola TaxID=2082293 RepID=A0A2J6PRG0_9HELO|nr:hypothetical protein NA56DRAFT_649448 [Hyaloscypha hepaticicola]